MVFHALHDDSAANKFSPVEFFSELDPIQLDNGFFETVTVVLPRISKRFFFLIKFEQGGLTRQLTVVN